MKLQYLGTAAAEGWPALFCQCESCRVSAEKGGKSTVPHLPETSCVHGQKQVGAAGHGVSGDHAVAHSNAQDVSVDIDDRLQMT